MEALSDKQIAGQAKAYCDHRSKDATFNKHFPFVYYTQDGTAFVKRAHAANHASKIGGGLHTFPNPTFNGGDAETAAAKNEPAVKKNAESNPVEETEKKQSSRKRRK